MELTVRHTSVILLPLRHVHYSLAPRLKPFSNRAVNLLTQYHVSAVDQTDNTTFRKCYFPLIVSFPFFNEFPAPKFLYKNLFIKLLRGVAVESDYIDTTVWANSVEIHTKCSGHVAEAALLDTCNLPSVLSSLALKTIVARNINYVRVCALKPLLYLDVQEQKHVGQSLSLVCYSEALVTEEQWNDFTAVSGMPCFRWKTHSPLSSCCVRVFWEEFACRDLLE